jgi:hypothetical protein
MRSVFSDEKKPSIAALSQTLPERLIEQVMPWSAIRCWNCSLVYWADSSGRHNTQIQKRRSARSGRAPLPSPGRPPVAGAMNSAALILKAAVVGQCSIGYSEYQPYCAPYKRRSMRSGGHILLFIAAKSFARAILGEKAYSSCRSTLRLRWFQIALRLRPLRRKPDQRSRHFFTYREIRKKWLSKEPLPDLAPDSPLRSFFESHCRQLGPLCGQLEKGAGDAVRL